MTDDHHDHDHYHDHHHHYDNDDNDTNNDESLHSSGASSMKVNHEDDDNNSNDNNNTVAAADGNDDENGNAAAREMTTSTTPTPTRTTQDDGPPTHKYGLSTLRSSIVLQHKRDQAQAQEKTTTRRTTKGQSKNNIGAGKYYTDENNEDDVTRNYQPGSTEPEWLAENLTEQPWHEIGNCNGALSATSNFELMVDQVTSLFLVRLKDLVLSKPLYAHEFMDSFGVDLSEPIRHQLRMYIAEIGSKYNHVHYHAFEHATHVTVSVNKLLSMVLNDQDIRVDSNLNSITSNNPSAPDGTESNETHPNNNHGDNNNNNPYAAPEVPTRRRATLQHIGAVPGRRVSLGSVESYNGDSRENDADRLHEATFGIYNNALLRFALMFSALIHDVDHQGVPNSTLVDEEDELAILHNDLSVAEQNSLQIAFSTLTQKRFALLKKCIIPDKETRKEFRRTVIDMVLATDISNPERMQIAQSKWNEAFDPPVDPQQHQSEHTSQSHQTNESLQSETSTIKEEDPFASDSRRNSATSNRGSGTGATTFTNAGAGIGGISNNTLNNTAPAMSKRYSLFTTTQALRQIQIERLGLRKSVDFGGKMVDVYASTSEGELKLKQHAVIDLMMNVVDVAHTMQSFATFVKWNKRLFKELLTAYHADRISWDPTMGWYGNQIQFYDAYIIPLAKKMQKCGVFGAKSSVFLYFAMENKRRWQMEGAEITEHMVDQMAKEVLMESLQDASQQSQCSSASSSLSP